MTKAAGTVVTVGTGPLTLLTILFVGLKLTGNIMWSWWWVLSPLWIGWVVFLAFALLCLIAFLILKAIE